MLLQNSSVGSSGFLLLIVFRFALQPLLTFLVLLPMLLPFVTRGSWEARARSFCLAHGYLLNRLLILASAIQCATPSKRLRV